MLRMVGGRGVGMDGLVQKEVRDGADRELGKA